jgi:hypothetical protein
MDKASPSYANIIAISSNRAFHLHLQFHGVWAGAYQNVIMHHDCKLALWWGGREGCLGVYIVGIVGSKLGRIS